MDGHPLESASSVSRYSGMQKLNKKKTKKYVKKYRELLKFAENELQSPTDNN